MLLAILILPTSTHALMKSDNYIIYETVMQSFDGPIISSITCASSDATSITVTWTTDVAADGFVIYSADSNLANSLEQGNSVKSLTSQSVTVSGLNSSTTYYYKVKSTRVNGGVTTDSAIYNCATTAAADTSCPDCPETTGGGGILIIDKTDKVAPQISDIDILDIRSDSAVISWTTDEDATSFVEYGKDITYGSTYGQWTYGTSHSVSLKNLLSETSYHFRVLSSDESGNLAQSADQIFTTISASEEIELGEEIEVEEGKSKEDILAEASKRAMDIIERLAGEVSLNVLESTLSLQHGLIEKLANLIPAPILSGEPRVEVEANRATVYWSSDKEANSLVAVAADADYDAGRDEPYTQVAGDAETMTRDHQVRIFGLLSNTLYHYQLRSKAAVGPTAKSRDFTFRTSLEALQITNYYSQIINETTAVFKWVTNSEANSAVKLTPYRGNVLAVEESKIFKDNEMSVIHEIMIAEFEAGVFYDIELSSQDARGIIATQLIPRFSTGKDDLPPLISHVKADSTVFLDKSNKIQTIIFWLTNEPSTSRVHWQEGVHGKQAELTNKTDLNFDYTKEHIMVFTKFKPNLVYSFKVESIDSGGNASISKTHTFMTPKQKESILQIIIRILENIFGWMRNIM